jgi:hypothetical protein
MTPAEIAEAIGTSWAAYLTRDRRQAKPSAYVYASAWRVCDRRMFLDMTQPENLPPWPAEVLAKFRRGDDRERDLLVDLSRIGRDAAPPFHLHGQQERFELRDRQGRIALVGKVDARLEIAGARPPLEVKAWHPNIVDRLETFADAFDNPWTASGAYQLLAYLYGAGEPYGFLLLDRSGIPRLLPVELEPHLDRMEEFLTKAERVLDHRAAGTVPAFIDDPAECRRCPWYGAVCNPPISANNAARILIDAELEAALARREALEAAAKEYDGIDRDVKARLRGVEHGIAGPFEIVGRWGKQSRIELPADLKKQYTITDPKGRFSLEITRL